MTKIPKITFITPKWLKDANSYALQKMTARLLEVIERDMFHAYEAMKKQLQPLYFSIEGCSKAQEKRSSNQ